MPLQFSDEPETGVIDIEGTRILLCRLTRDEVRKARAEARRKGIISPDDGDLELSDYLAERSIVGCENLLDMNGKELVFNERIRSRLYGEIIRRDEKRKELLTFIAGPLGN